MASIRWLHLTDLHIGMQKIADLWPSVASAFERDLRTLHRTVGQFDLVFFSGDLVHSGKESEYKKLNELLERLWSQLKTMGSDPVLLAVPGNHDLVRPSQSAASVRALLNWTHDQDLRGTMFWDDTQGNEYRHIVDSAFAEYSGWMDRWSKEHPLPPWVTRTREGLLPGDFAATVEKEGLTLGVVGINSAFLQLGDRVGRGQIALHPKQLHNVCGGDPNTWATRHDVCFLMTHHPPDWLAPDALAFYQGNILLPEWFAGHLCGHAHDAQTFVQSAGGAAPRRLFQAASLFGLESWADTHGTSYARIHGYSAGCLDLDDQGRISLRIWPRLARRHPSSGQWEIVPDYEHFSLHEDAGNSLVVDLGVRPPVPAPARPPFSPSLAPQPPGFGYDEAWYVPHEREERLVLSVLGNPGAPVVLTAPPMSGKSTVLRRLITLLRKEHVQQGVAGVVIPVDLGMLTDAAPDDPAACFRELAVMLVDGYAKCLEATGHPPDTSEWVDAAWQRPGTPDRYLSRLLEQHILTMHPARVVLVMDRFDRIIGRPAGNPVARMLRRWMDTRDDVRWASVRLLLAASGTRLHFSVVDEVSEFFTAVTSVRLGGFTLQQLRLLAERYRRVWSDDELARLLQLVDGQPYLTRLIMFLEAMGIAKSELLDIERLKAEHCALQLRQIWLLLQEQEQIRRPLCALLHDPALKLPKDDLDRLHQTGLVRDCDGAETVPNALLASYIKERC